jgi:hypothetical protein
VQRALVQDHRERVVGIGIAVIAEDVAGDRRAVVAGGLVVDRDRPVVVAAQIDGDGPLDPAAVPRYFWTRLSPSSSRARTESGIEYVQAMVAPPGPALVVDRSDRLNWPR